MTEDYRNVYGAGRPVPPPSAPAGALVSETGEPSPPPTLERFKKHAARFGTDNIYEIASETLILKDLIELVHTLRGLPSTGGGRYRASKVWALDKVQREHLTERMQSAGYSEKAINRVVKG
jgi:hypothetical protein